MPARAGDGVSGEASSAAASGSNSTPSRRIRRVERRRRREAHEERSVMERRSEIATASLHASLFTAVAIFSPRARGRLPRGPPPRSLAGIRRFGGAAALPPAGNSHSAAAAASRARRAAVPLPAAPLPQEAPLHRRRGRRRGRRRVAEAAGAAAGASSTAAGTRTPCRTILCAAGSRHSSNRPGREELQGVAPRAAGVSHRKTSGT